MSDRQYHNKRVGGNSCVTEASSTSTTTRTTHTSPQLQQEKENSNRNRVEVLVQEIGLEASWGFVTIVQELGFDSVFRIVNQISKEQQQQQSGSATDYNAAIRYSVSSSSGAAAAGAPAVSPAASSTHPSPTPVAFVESDFVVNQDSEEEPEEEEEEGEGNARTESRGRAFTSAATSTVAAAYPEQQRLAKYQDEKNSKNELIKFDTYATKSNKRKQQSPSTKDGVDPSNPSDSLKAKKNKTMKNRQGGEHTDYETAASQKQPANNISNHAPDGNTNNVLNYRAEEDKKEENYIIDTNDEEGTHNETDSSTKDNCCRFCNNPEWESKIYYKCGTVISKCFPKTNQGCWHKGTIRMHHQFFFSDSCYKHEEQVDGRSEEDESEQQSFIFNEIQYEDGNVENIKQDDLKLQLMNGSGVRILHSTKKPTTSNSARHNRVDVVPPPNLSDNKFDQNWLVMHHRLKQFKAKNGHCRVPTKYDQDPSLGMWVSTQRTFYNKGTLAADRAEKLNVIGFEWNARAETWDEMFHRLEQFKAENGHCRVPFNYGTDPSLGLWVSKQRKNYKKGIMAYDRAEKLIDIGFEWDAHTKTWDEMFGRLEQFKAENGNCRVPATHGPDPSLGYWVKTQRKLNKKGTLAPDRVEKLNKIGFVWDLGSKTPDQAWQEKYDRLIIFKAEKGHCRVPARHGTDPSLGMWVSTQRHHYKKGNMASGRIEKLEEIGFEWAPHSHKVK